MDNFGNFESMRLHEKIMVVQKEISRILLYASYADRPAPSRIWPTRAAG